MKNCVLLFLGLSLLLTTACNKEKNSPAPAGQGTASGTVGAPGKNPYLRYAGDDYSQAISKEEANTMIQSYLTSINYPSNNSSLRSLTFDADTLRTYLNDTTHGKIVTLKFMLAHQASYADSFYGIPAGLSPKAMTLIVVGLDENDHYVYSGGCRVYDHFSPCPSNCNNSGVLLN